MSLYCMCSLSLKLLFSIVKIHINQSLLMTIELLNKSINYQQLTHFLYYFWNIPVFMQILFIYSGACESIQTFPVYRFFLYTTLIFLFYSTFSQISVHFYTVPHYMQVTIQHLLLSLHVSDDTFGFELQLEDKRTPQRGKHAVLIRLLSWQRSVVISQW